MVPTIGRGHGREAENPGRGLRIEGDPARPLSRMRSRATPSRPDPSSTMFSFARLLRWGLGVMLLSAVGAAPLLAQEAPAPSRSDSSRHPNEVPYATDRSLAYHVLAAPAYVLHGATRPVGWAMEYAERRYPGLFEGRLPTRGGLPLVEFGGPVGVMGGLLLYDRRVLGSRHELQVQGLYGESNAFRTRGQYRMPRVLGPGTEVDVELNYFSDPESEFFLGGNDSDRDADRTIFVRRQMDVFADVEYRPRDRGIGGEFGVRYEHIDADGGAGERGRHLGQVDPPGLRVMDLLSPRITLGVARTRGRPRTYRGTDVLLQLEYTHDLNAPNFRYGRYVAEVRQYVPVLVFPETRRLALRARLEQVEPLFGGRAVPFFQLPGLGGQNSLRGVRYNRFQDEGALTLTAEYRYPIWDLLDAVAFVDAGQVFPDLDAVALDRFHWSVGGGVHLLNSNGLSFRFEVAGSAEGARTILTVQPSFRRVVR